MSRGFSGGKQLKKIANGTIAVEFVYSRQKVHEDLFILKTAMQNMGVSDHCYFFASSSDRRCPHMHGKR